MNSKNFYLHIPFCRQKCPYCKFALTPIFDGLKKRRYLEYMKKEIQEYFSHQKTNEIKTIYFGWGTPSVLGIEEVRGILECFPWYNSIRPEITFECNPEDIIEEYIWWILHLGINRISLGVQSLNDTTLKAIHRSDRESIFHALENIQLSIHSGINISLNIDIILWLPFSQSGETLTYIRELHEKFPHITHTSVYMLEDGLYPKDWKKNSINEMEIKQEYSEICQYFESLGWRHYEISNWAKPGYESVHNRGYWNHVNYRGFGLSATSYENGKRWENSASFSTYYRWENISTEILTPEQIQLEKIIFGIRTFSLDADIFPNDIFEELIHEWAMEVINGKIVLTPAWIFQENTIIAKLIEYIE